MRIVSMLVLLLALAGAAVAVSAEGAPAAAGDGADGITVQGTASVRAVPDRAQIGFGVESRGETARQALAANSAEMRKVIAALRAAGATQLQTQAVSLQPRYVENGGVDGYVATNSVSATIGDLARAGAIVDAAVAAGANQVYGPSLSRSDRSELERQALRAAFADAKARAQALAAAAGRTLGQATQIAEGGGVQPGPLYDRAQAAESSTPIEAGEQEIGASVTVTFAVS